jgi:hypothetical protein
MRLLQWILMRLRGLDYRKMLANKNCKMLANKNCTSPVFLDLIRSSIALGFEPNIFHPVFAFRFGPGVPIGKRLEISNPVEHLENIPTGPPVDRILTNRLLMR